MKSTGRSYVAILTNLLSHGQRRCRYLEAEVAVRGENRLHGAGGEREPPALGHLQRRIPQAPGALRRGAVRRALCQHARGVAVARRGSRVGGGHPAVRGLPDQGQRHAQEVQHVDGVDARDGVVGDGEGTDVDAVGGNVGVGVAQEAAVVQEARASAGVAALVDDLSAGVGQAAEARVRRGVAKAEAAGERAAGPQRGEARPRGGRGEGVEEREEARRPGPEPRGAWRSL